MTVVGLLAPTGFHQWVGRAITPEAILKALTGVRWLVTFNGDRFDLPVLRRAMGMDLRDYVSSRDLLYDCWRLGLYGGLKAVEVQLGIPRTLDGMDGYEAMRLWERYVAWDDAQALQLLCQYNREDVMNLPRVEQRLRQLKPEVVG